MQVHTRLQEIRKARGVSVSDLARRVGVSRQTIYAIEDGSYIPNTTVSLQLSRVLDVTVEEIFSIAEEETTKPVTVDLLLGDKALEGQLVRLAQVNGRLMAIPAPFLPAYLPQADGIIECFTRSKASIASALAKPENGRRILIAGCDPALSLLQDALRTPEIEIINLPCSSRHALQLLKQGRVHAAGSHLLDESTGEYNVSMVRRILPRDSVRVVAFAAWEQGLLVPCGNPKGLRSVSDLASGEIAIINRQKGSGSRDVLDRNLRQLGIKPEQVKGYQSTADGHLAAAWAVAAGTADCCIASRSAARCFGLGFIGLTEERFDLSFDQASFNLPGIEALLDALNRSHFQKRLRCIAGYDTAHTGEVLR